MLEIKTPKGRVSKTPKLYSETSRRQNTSVAETSLSPKHPVNETSRHVKSLNLKGRVSKNVVERKIFLNIEGNDSQGIC